MILHTLCLVATLLLAALNRSHTAPAMVEQIKPFQSRAFALGSPYDLEFSGRPLKAIGLRFAGALNTTIPVTVVDDASWRLLKTPEINQAENPLIRMSGPSWRHLSALINGGYDHFAAGTALATPNNVCATAILDLQKLQPLAMINASDKKVFVRGEFTSTLGDYATGTAPGGVTGTLRPFGVSSELDPSGGFLRPKFSEVSLAIANNDDMQQTIKFESDTVLMGCMLQAIQGSATGKPRSDGLVKAVRLDAVNGENGNVELHRKTWGQARVYTSFRADFNDEDYVRSRGVVFLPTQTRANPQWNNAILMRAGDSLTFHFDMTPTVDEEFTGVTAAAGDSVLITVVGFTPVAGTGDTAAQIRNVASETQVAPSNAAQVRSRRRRARAGVN